MVQGKHPFPSFSAKAGNPEIQSVKLGPRFAAITPESKTSHTLNGWQ